MEQELPVLEKKLKEHGVTRLIVDSYQAEKGYLESLNQCVKVIYMDDMAEDIYQIAGVIHYSNWPWDTTYTQRYEGLDTICMAGMEYTPLRAEFYPSVEERRKKNILLTTGGTDPYDVAGSLLEYVKEQKAEQGQLPKENSWITLWENVNNMGEIMRDSYLAVSAGGTTLYELCACKVPTISFSFADNQEGFTEEMGEQGILFYAGDARKEESLIEIIYNKLADLWMDERLCGQFRENMGRLVDGKGVERIVDKVLRM